MGALYCTGAFGPAAASPPIIQVNYRGSEFLVSSGSSRMTHCLKSTLSQVRLKTPNLIRGAGVTMDHLLSGEICQFQSRLSNQIVEGVKL